jgi:hypothetical protein
MAFTKLEPTSVNTSAAFTFANANVTANLNVSGKTNLGSVSNLTITGGTSGYVLRTNGAGVLSWVAQTGGGGTPGGNTTEVQYNNAGSFDGSDSFKFNNGSNTLSVTNIESNGYLLTNLNGSNISGQIGNALLSSTVYTNAQPNITSVGTLASLTVTANITSGNANLGNAATASYFIGNGSLLTGIASSSSYANTNVAAYLPTYTGNVSANYFIGNGATLTYITGSTVNGNVTSAVQSHYANIANSVAGGNVSGQVGNALVAGTVYTNAQPNITSVGTLSSLTVTGNITSGNANLGNLAIATYFTGNGSLLTSITGGNVNGNVTSAVQSHYANIANSVAGSNVSGNVTSAVQSHYSNIANSVSGSNISGQVGNALVADTVYNNAQPNITSLGTLSSLSITGNITSGNANLGNLAIATYFTGNGSLLTSITGGNVSGNVASAVQSHYANIANSVTGSNVSGNVDSAVQSHYANIANSVSGSNVSGNVDSAVQSHYANIANSVTGGNVSGQVGNALVAGAVYTNAQPNITSVGTLTSLAITGNTTTGNLTGATLVSATNLTGTLTTAAQPNITSTGTLVSVTVSGDATITGNLTVSGSYEYANVTSFNVKDPIIEQGGNPNGTPLASNDGKDRGQILHYFTTAAVDAFMGWDNSNAEFALGSNVSVSSEVVTFNSFGNIRAGYFLGNGSQLTGLPEIYGNSNVANYLPTYTGNVTANYFIGNGSTLTYITGGNVNGNVPSAVQSHYANISNSVAGQNVSGYVSLATSANTAGTVTTNAQPNITSVGTLSSLTITGNLTSGNLTVSGIGNIGYGQVSEVLKLSNSASAADKWLTFKNLYGEFQIGTQGNVGAYLYNTATSPLGFYTGASKRLNIASTGETQILSTTTSTSNSTGALQVSGGVGVQGNINADYFTGNGSLLTSLTGGNVTGQVGNALIAGTVYTNDQPNITSVGTLTNLTITGNVTSGDANLGNLATASYFTGNGYLLTGVISATVTANAQPNITSVGTLASLAVTGNTTTGNLTGATLVSATNLTGTLTTAAQPNITSTGTLTSLTVTGNISSGNANLGNLITSNYSTAVLTTGAQPNITSVGTLASLIVTANSNVGNLYSASVVQGSTLTSNIATGTAPLTVTSTTRVSNLNASYSNVSDYAVVTTQTTGNFYPVFVSSSSTGNYALASNANISVNVATGSLNVGAGTGGNITGANLVSSNYFSGNGSLLTSLTGGNVSGQVGNALIAGTVYTNAQPNITSVGTLTSLTVTGNISAGNLTGATLVSATNITGTLTTNAQPNITSVGTLTSLTITGNLTSGNANLGNLITSNYSTAVLTTGAQPNITSVGTLTSLTITGNLTSGNANLGNLITSNYSTAVLTTGAQPNITSVGTLTSLTVTGNISSGNANLGNLITSNYSTAVLTTGAQPNITSVGTLASLTVTANASVGNLNAGTAVVASTLTSNVATGTAPLTVTSTTRVNNLNVSYSNVSDYDSVTTATTGTFYPTFVNGSTSANYQNYSNTALSFNAATGNLITTLLTGTLTTAAQPNITSHGTLTALTVAGNFVLQQSQETFQTKTSVGGAVTYDYSTGATFYHTSVTSNIQATLTNLDTTTGRSSVFAMIIAQGATPYVCTAITVGGASQTIKWVSGGTQPTGTASKVDAIVFTILNNSGTYTVLGQLSSYG